MIDPSILEAARAAWAVELAEREASYAEWLAAGNTEGSGGEDTVYDELGCYLTAGASLKGLALNADWEGYPDLAGGRIVRRSAATQDTLALRYYLGRKFDERDAEYLPDEPHNWALFEDTDRRHGRAPRTLADPPAVVAWAQRWRESHRGLRAWDLAAIAAPGKQVAFFVWSPKPLTEADTRALAWEISGDATEPRFRPVLYPFTLPDAPDSDDSYRSSPAYRKFGAIYLPAEVTAPVRATLPRASSVARAPRQAAKLLTGIEAIDRLADGAPGIARDLLVVAAGLEGSGKSSLYFEIAETALAAGSVVLWAAHDEQGHRIRQRMLKRRGLPAKVAETLPAAELAKLDDLDFFVLGRTDPLETSWQAAYEHAAGRPLLVVVDSLQKVNLGGLGDQGQRERIDVALRLLEACQERWPATVLATSEATSSGKAKGSTSIGHSAGMVLELRRQLGSNTVRIRVAKSRDGGEGAAIAVVLDRERQRVLDPEAAKQAKSTAELRALIVAAVVGLGDAADSQNAIADAVEGVGSKRVHAEVRAMKADCSLLWVDGVFRVP